MRSAIVLIGILFTSNCQSPPIGERLTDSCYKNVCVGDIRDAAMMQFAKDGFELDVYSCDEKKRPVGADDCARISESHLFTTSDQLEIWFKNNKVLEIIGTERFYLNEF